MNTDDRDLKVELKSKKCPRNGWWEFTSYFVRHNQWLLGQSFYALSKSWKLLKIFQYWIQRFTSGGKSLVFTMWMKSAVFILLLIGSCMSRDLGAAPVTQLDGTTTSNSEGKRLAILQSIATKPHHHFHFHTPSYRTEYKT